MKLNTLISKNQKSKKDLVEAIGSSVKEKHLEEDTKVKNQDQV